METQKTAVVTDYGEVAVSAAADSTVLFDVSDPAINSMRIWVKNVGGTAVALDTAKLQGSFDDGTTWHAIDATAFTTAFGTLADAATGTILETSLNWPRLRMVVSAGTGGTVVQTKTVAIY